MAAFVELFAIALKGLIAVGLVIETVLPVVPRPEVVVSVQYSVELIEDVVTPSAEPEGPVPNA